MFDAMRRRDMRGQGTVDGGQQGSAPHGGFLRPVALAFLLVLLWPPRISAQNPQYNTSGFPRNQMQDSVSSLAGDSGNPEMEAKRLEALNAERQKSLVSDTNKLLRLTAELNSQINGTHPARLSEAQLRMVAEIEKLARNIREKMCTSVKAVPQFGPAPALMIPQPPGIQ